MCVNWPSECIHILPAAVDTAVSLTYTNTSWAVTVPIRFVFPHSFARARDKYAGLALHPPTVTQHQNGFPLPPYSSPRSPSATPFHKSVPIFQILSSGPAEDSDNFSATNTFLQDSTAGYSFKYMYTWASRVVRDVLANSKKEDKHISPS